MEPLSLGGWGQGQNSSLWPPSPCMFLVTCCLVCCCQYPGPATVWDTQWLVPRYCADPWVTSRRGHKGKAETGPIVPTADTHTTDMTLIYNTLIVNTHTHTTLATHPHSSVFISWMRMRICDGCHCIPVISWTLQCWGQLSASRGLSFLICPHLWHWPQLNIFFWTFSSLLQSLHHTEICDT